MTLDESFSLSACVTNEKKNDSQARGELSKKGERVSVPWKVKEKPEVLYFGLDGRRIHVFL